MSSPSIRKRRWSIPKVASRIRWPSSTWIRPRRVAAKSWGGSNWASATSCIISDGTRAAPRSVPTRRIRTWSAAISSSPDLRSSRIFIVDTKPDPRHPTLVRTIEPEEVAARTGYSRPHTVHCGPDAIYMNALGAPNGEGPGGNLSARPRQLRRPGPLGGRSRTAVSGLRFLVASGLRRGDYQRMGHARAWSRTA